MQWGVPGGTGGEAGRGGGAAATPAAIRTFGVPHVRAREVRTAYVFVGTHGHESQGRRIRYP